MDLKENKDSSDILERDISKYEQEQSTNHLTDNSQEVFDSNSSHNNQNKPQNSLSTEKPIEVLGIDTNPPPQNERPNSNERQQTPPRKNSTGKTRHGSSRKSKSPAPQPPSNPSSQETKTRLPSTDTQQSSSNGDVDSKRSSGASRNEHEDKFGEIMFRPKAKDHTIPVQHRASYLNKTKGNLSFKKKGTFSKWKDCYIVVDDCTLQMNFFKSQDEYEHLAMSQMTVDLRFVNDIKPQRPKFFRSTFPFKLHRRAGLSTIKLAAPTEEERAKWITTLECIIRRIPMTQDMEIGVGQERSSILLDRGSCPGRMSSNSETQTAVSSTDQDDENLIKPKKPSIQGGFKINSTQISSLKLKRVSSEKEHGVEKKVEIEEQHDDSFDPQQIFGVNLRRVNTEKLPSKEREKSPDLEEFEAKYHSLSLSRKNKAPKLPLNENLIRSHVLETRLLDQEQKVERSQFVDTKDVPRKRSPSPKIPISKGVESVIKSQETEEKIQSHQKFNVCHATSTVISFDDSSAIELTEDGFAVLEETLVTKPDIVASLFVVDKLKESPDETKSPVVSDKPDILKPSRIMPEEQCEIDHGQNDQQCKDENHPKYETVEDTGKPLETEALLEDTARVAVNISSQTSRETEFKSSTQDNEACHNSQVENKTPIDTSPKVRSNWNENSKITGIPNYSERRQTAGPMTENQIESIVFGRRHSLSVHQGEYTGLSKDGKNGQEARLSTHSYHSQVSNESDGPPLPKLNFLGKDNCPLENSKHSQSSDEMRLDKNSSSDEIKVDKNSSSDEIKVDKNSSSGESISHFKEKGSKIDSESESSGSMDIRSSLVLPEFTVVEEKAEDIVTHLMEQTEVEEKKVEVNVESQNTETLGGLSEPKDLSKSKDDGLEYETSDHSRLSERVTSLEVTVRETVNGSQTINEGITIIETSNDLNRLTHPDEVNNTQDRHVEIFIRDSCPQNMGALTANDTTDNSIQASPKENGDIIDETPFETDDIVLTEPSEKEFSSLDQVVEVKTNENVNNSEDLIKEQIVSLIEQKEDEDFFPQFGETRFRNKNSLSVEDKEVRTSGIAGLKEFLKENESTPTPEVKSGISRLGHSPAIEKLKEEIV